MCGVCVSYSPPPFVFIAGSHGVKLAEPPYASNEEATCGKVEAYPTAPSFVQQPVLGLFVLTPLVLTCLKWSELSSWATLGPFEPESVL